MKKLIIAVWSVNTQGMQNATINARMNSLKQAVELTYSEIRKYVGKSGSSMGNHPLGIFVAPEYLFANPVLTGGHETGDQRHIDELEKTTRLAELVQLSNTVPGLVIVPGTIAWRKTLARPLAKQTSSKTGQAKPLTREQKATTALTDYAQIMGLPLNRGLAGQRYDANARAFVDAPTTQEKLDLIGGVGQPLGISPVTHMARNTAYVLLDGAVLLKYNKKGDYHEILTGNDTVHIPGCHDGRFLIKPNHDNHRMITVGIEICLDHVYKTAARDIPNLGQTDIHIITSAQVKEKIESLIAKESGFLVHACSNRSMSSVKMKKIGWFGSPSTSELEPFFSGRVGGFDLMLWEIELDLSISEQLNKKKAGSEWDITSDFWKKG